MKNIKGIIKYEFLNLHKKFFIAFMMVLLLFGMQQQLWSLRGAGKFYITVISFLKASWLPINLVYIPILLINEIVGSSNQEIFQVLNTSKLERFMGKFLVGAIINVFVIMTQLVAILIIVAISKAPVGYCVYLISRNIFYMSVGLFCCSSIGLLVGETVSRYSYKIVSYALLVIFFLITNNFYKSPDLFLPIIQVDALQSNFQLFDFSRLTLYHYIIWISIGVLGFYVSYSIEKIENLRVRNLIIPLCLVIVIAVASIVGMKYNAKSYLIYKDNINENYEKKSGDIEGFEIESYDMTLKLDNEISSECSMKIRVDRDNLKSMNLKLFNSLKVASVKINNKSAKFSRNNDDLTIALDEKYNKNQSLDLYVKYSGILNVLGQQARKLFFVNSKAIFLADYFPWYPKTEWMGNDKKYSVKIESGVAGAYEGIYSNLEDKGSHVLEGEGREIYLLKSNLISKHIYKGIEFIGNSEAVMTDSRCEDILKGFKDGNRIPKDIKRVFLTTPREKEYLIHDLYNGQVLYGQSDLSNTIRDGR